MAYKIPDGTTRMNVYLRLDLYEKLKAYCADNFMSQTGFVNMVLKQYFDGQEAMQNMGNIAQLLQAVKDVKVQDSILT